MNSKGKIAFAILAVAIMIVASASVVTGNLASNDSNELATSSSNDYSLGVKITDSTVYQETQVSVIKEVAVNGHKIAVGTGEATVRSSDDDVYFTITWTQNAREYYINSDCDNITVTAQSGTPDYSLTYTSARSVVVAIYNVDAISDLTVDFAFYHTTETTVVDLAGYIYKSGQSSNQPSLNDICSSLKAYQDDGTELGITNSSVQVYYGETVTLEYVLKDGYTYESYWFWDENRDYGLNEYASANGFTVDIDWEYNSLEFGVNVVQTAGYINLSSSMFARYMYSPDNYWYANNYGLNNSLFATYEVDDDGMVNIKVTGYLRQQTVTEETVKAGTATNAEKVFYMLNQDYAKDGTPYGVVLGSYTNSQIYIDDYIGMKKTTPVLIDRDNGYGSILYLSENNKDFVRNVYIGDGKDLIKVGTISFEDVTVGAEEIVAKVTTSEGTIIGSYTSLSDALAAAELAAVDTTVEILKGKNAYIGNAESYFYYNGGLVNNYIASNVTLVIPSGSTVQINGALLNLGKIKNSGDIIVNTILQNGHLNYEKYSLTKASFESSGNIYVAEQASLANYDTFVNSGKIVNDSGSYESLAQSFYKTLYWSTYMQSYDPLFGDRLDEGIAVIAKDEGLNIDYFIDERMVKSRSVSYMSLYTVLEEGITNSGVFTNNGTIENNGLLANNLTIGVASSFTNNGTITCSDDAAIVNGLFGSGTLQSIVAQFDLELSGNGFSLMQLADRLIEGLGSIDGKMHKIDADREFIEDVAQFLYNLRNATSSSEIENFIGNFVQYDLIPYIKEKIKETTRDIDQYIDKLKSSLLSAIPKVIEAINTIEPMGFVNGTTGTISMNKGTFVNYYGKFVNSGSYTGAGELDDLASIFVEFNAVQYSGEDGSQGVTVLVSAKGAQSIDALTILTGMTFGKTMFDYSSKSVMIASNAYVVCTVVNADGTTEDIVRYATSITYESGKAIMDVDLTGIDGIKMISVGYDFDTEVNGTLRTYQTSSDAQRFISA